MTAEKFLSESYTCYHAVENGAKLLEKAGFVSIDTSKKSEVGYYRASGGSLLCMRVGGESTLLVLSHTDSPSLRIRYRGEGGEPYMPDVEKYGGGILRSFIDRKLKIAGRVVVKEKGGLKCKTVCSDFGVVIPSLAIHLGGGSEELTLSREMRPLAGNCSDLYASLGYENAVDGDLFCVPAEQPFEAGANGEYLCSPRIDNLVSVYASLRAVIDCKNTATVIAACFNNEETGSETREGAQSQLLDSFVRAVLSRCGKKQTPESIFSHAFALSCDGAHAFHPSYSAKYAQNAPLLGGGVVIKRNDRYSTDALTAAAAAEIFGRAGVKTQVYFHNADLRCGSTIGLMASRMLGCAVCDIGVGQLAMHSAVETAARRDIEDLCTGLTAFFGSEIYAYGDRIEIK